MKFHKKTKDRLCEWLEATRFHLSRPDALVLLSLFGVISGFLAGGVIVLFRLIVEGLQEYLLPGKGAENYEGLSASLRFLFPFISGLLLALLFYKWSKGIRVLGIANVIERMAYHQGYLTFRGFLLQFLGASIAIIGGQSVGREGPHVHLGASIASLFGQAIKAPNNSIRTMMACGSAAGIAASFNTPLAGVIFALEVVMMEYTVSSFIPIILASVVATALSNAVIGDLPAFHIAEMKMGSLQELPIILALGLVIGSFAALFNHTLHAVSKRTRSIEIWWKLIMAGTIVGILGIIQPEVLGIGYDTVNLILLGQFSIVALFSLMFIKLLATSVSIGLGVPGGMIGPAFFIGAALGGLIGSLASHYFDIDPAFIGFYALLGMGAMMGASLQAPLAALTAIVELTYNPGIIMPAMLTIVVAQLTASEIFRKKSLFLTILQSNGLDYDTSPVMQILRGIGVASRLNRNYVRHPEISTYEDVAKLLEKSVDWIVIDGHDKPLQVLLPASDLAKYIQTMELDNNELNLMEIPAKRLSLMPISVQANLLQAHEKFSQGAEALYVIFKEDQTAENSRVYGILTKEIVESAYKV